MVRSEGALAPDKQHSAFVKISLCKGKFCAAFLARLKSSSR
jgi:hypothetical protein